MIVVIKQDPAGKIIGWMTGADPHELRRKADSAWAPDLAQRFYAMEFTPAPGKYELTPDITMLVE